MEEEKAFSSDCIASKHLISFSVYYDTGISAPDDLVLPFTRLLIFHFYYSLSLTGDRCAEMRMTETVVFILTHTIHRILLSLAVCEYTTYNHYSMIN